MTRRKKLVLIGGAILFICAVACLMSFSRRPMTKRQIRQNAGEMMAAAEAALSAGENGAIGLSGVRETRIYPEKGLVVFEVRAFGLAPSGRYIGAIYSADGNPHPYPGMEAYEEIPHMFGWRWEEQTGDNGCYIEHVEGNLYYFEAWF